MSDDYKRYSDPSWEYPNGKERLGRFLKNFCAAFADWRWETTNLYASDDMVILETSERGTWTKPWDLFGNILEPSGETFEAAGSCPRGCSAPELSYHVGRDRMAPSISTSGQAGRRSETSAGGVSTSNDPRTTPRNLAVGGAMRC
jgi:hypothetical protein